MQQIDFSSILKEHRHGLKMTQDQMANLIGIPRGRYSSYEEGRAAPGIEETFRISQVLGYDTIDSFLKLGKPENPVSKLEEGYRKLPKSQRDIVDFIINLH